MAGRGAAAAPPNCSSPTAADSAARRLLPGWRHTKAGCVRAGVPVAVTPQPRAPAPAAALHECAAQLVCECDATDAPPTAEVDAGPRRHVRRGARHAALRAAAELRGGATHRLAAVPGVVAGPPSALSISSLVAKDPRSPLTAGSRSELLVRLRDAHDNVLDGGSLAASDVRVVLSRDAATDTAEGGCRTPRRHRR